MTELLDPADDVAVTRAVLAVHDLPGGWWCTPRRLPTVPARSSTMCWPRWAAPRPAWPTSGVPEIPAWQAGMAWSLAERIRQVVVLRAHLLTPTTWERVLELELARCTGIELVLGMPHRPGSRGLAALLKGRRHQIITGPATAQRPPPAPDPPAGPPFEPPAIPPVAEGALPPLPDTDLPRFRADAYRALSSEDFAVVDAVYGHGLDAACSWLCAQPERLAAHNQAEHFLHQRFPSYLDPAELSAGVALMSNRCPSPVLRQVAAGLLCITRTNHRAYLASWGHTAGLHHFLAALVAASPRHRHSIALIRGAQAGVMLHGLLL